MRLSSYLSLSLDITMSLSVIRECIVFSTSPRFPVNPVNRPMLPALFKSSQSQFTWTNLDNCISAFLRSRDEEEDIMLSTCIISNALHPCNYAAMCLTTVAGAAKWLTGNPQFWPVYR